MFLGKTVSDLWSSSSSSGRRQMVELGEALHLGRDMLDRSLMWEWLGTLTRTLLDRSLWQWVGRSLWLWLDRSLMWESLGTLTRTWHNSGRGVV